MTKNDADINVILRKVENARKRNIEVDVVFVVMRRIKRKVYEVLLGRHSKIGDDTVATHVQGNLPHDAMLDESWTCLCDVFHQYIDVVRAPDLVTVGPPMFVRNHIAHDGRKKLLLYVSVGMPMGTVFVSKERDNKFCEYFWQQTDEEELHALLQPIRCHTKSTGHLDAILMAQSMFGHWHY